MRKRLGERQDAGKGRARSQENARPQAVAEADDQVRERPVAVAP